MKTTFYLTVNSKGVVKATKHRAGVDFDQVSVGVTMELPDNLFMKPQISATILVNAKDVQPFNINADTANAVKGAIEQATGMQIRLHVENPES